MNDLRTFSSDKHDQQRPSIVEAMKDAGELPQRSAQTEVEERRQPQPAHSGEQKIRPPSIVVETRIPNVLIDVQEQQDIFHTVVVVQGDDPAEVKAILDSLKKSLGGEINEEAEA